MKFLFVRQNIDNQHLSSALGTDLYNTIKLQKSSLEDLISSHVSPYADFRVIDQSDIDAYSAQDRVIIWPSSIAVSDWNKFDILIQKILFSHYPIHINIGSGFIFAGQICDFTTPSNEAITLLHENYLIEITKLSDLRELVHKNFHSRFFNSLQLNTEGTIVKSSQNKDKLKQEYTFLNSLPEKLEKYYVKSWDYRENDDTAQYTMEQIHALDGSLLFINGSLNGTKLSNFLEEIITYFRLTIDLNRNKKSNTYDFIIDKIISRHSQLKSWDGYNNLNHFINAHTDYQDFQNVIDVLLSTLKKSKSKIVNSGDAFSHGDLCLSNILYDDNSGLLKLIDPRGGSDSNILLSPYYDAAKMSHSLLGGYDFIVNNLTDIHFSPNMKAELTFPKTFPKVDKNMSHLAEALDLDFNLIRTIEASLFLSMLPLHTDSVKKLHMLCLRGIHILKAYQ